MLLGDRVRSRMLVESERAANYKLNRSNSLRLRFALSDKDYALLLEDQGGVCAICGKPEATKQKDRVLPLAVDHNHDTGIVRGLLCRRCNTGIGFFSDTSALLRKAGNYIEYHNLHPGHLQSILNHPPDTQTA